MATVSVKSVGNISRWRLAATKSLFSASECLVQKPALNLENCIIIGRNSTTGLKLVHSPTSTSASMSNQLFQPERLTHQDPWMAGVDSKTFISSQQVQTNNQYVCPSRLSQLLSHLVINDGLSDIKSFYDCPIANHFDVQKITPNPSKRDGEMLDPPTNTEQPSKEAKIIMKIRRRKMKKHQLKRLRKRMYFVWKKQKERRRAKLDAIYWKEINGIKREAEEFDAKSFVKEQLEKARKGGFYINVFDSKI